ncbi:MAG: hypothetical protein C0503_00655 [Gemmatimonas sp.]|nr:hypothetical protein [Gemmatimonas sp.]
MICAVCNKESKNLRVCPYCFTPYPAEGPSAKRTTSTRQAPSVGTGASGGAGAPALSEAVERLRALALQGWAFYRKQTPVVRYSSAGILLVLVLWAATGEEPAFEPGVVQSEIIATPMQREEALAIIKTTRETAIVDVQQDEVFVSYPAATFPVREEGQLALVQQFTNADEIVEGRKRRIYYYNPNGKLFAQADGVRGVVLVR